MITERLQLAVGPGVQDPVLDTGVGVLSLILGLVPGVLDLGNQRVLVCLGGILDFNTLLLEISAQLLIIPLLVWADSMVFPVLLDELLEILPVGGRWVGDIVVGKPTLELGLMPLVVGLLERILAIVFSSNSRPGRRCSRGGRKWMRRRFGSGCI